MGPGRGVCASRGDLDASFRTIKNGGIPRMNNPRKISTLLLATCAVVAAAYAALTIALAPISYGAV